MRRFTIISILALAFLVPSREIAFAEGGIAWDPKGVPVCTASGNQQNIKMVRDAFGGAIIVWEDYRGGSYSDIYAQRIDKNGYRLWGEYGVAVSTGPLKKLKPVVVADGSGGAIIAWEDYRNGPNRNIYAQRIDYMGMPMWQTDGLPLAGSTTQGQSYPDVVRDGVGGAVIVWQQTDGVNQSIMAQRIDVNGTLLWGASGMIMSSGTDSKELPKIVNDGMECVIITWQDKRNLNYDIFAQRMDIGTGSTSWTPNGEPVSDVSAFDQKNPQIVSDGLGGAIIAWTDSRNGNSDIYAQWISSAGVGRWQVGTGDLNGIPVCKMDGEQSNPAMTNSLIGRTTDGAIIAWVDTSGPNGDIYAVKAGLYESNSDLTLGAKLIATGSQVQKCPRLVSDYQGGGIGAWIENDFLTSQYKIFATKRDRYGEPVWNIYPGVLVCRGSGINNHQIVNDDAGGIIVAWEAIGASSNYDIFAQRVMEDAYIRSASICGRVTLSDGETGIPGVEVWALKGEELVSSGITDTKGYYKIAGLVPESLYLVRANWWVKEIESSVSKETSAPSYYFNFTLELNYKLGTIAGNVSGVEREAKRVSVAGFKNSLSSGNGTAFVELEQRGKVMVRVPLEMDGSYSIPNLLPGRFVARAYNGSIYSNPRIAELKEGETLRVDFAFGIMPEETVFNYPNPAEGGSTTIRYYCGYTDPEAEIKIYNISGELVRKVADNEIGGTDAPIYRFLWDCKNNSGKEIASGIYIYMVEVKEKGGNGSKKVMKRMAVIR